MTESILKIKKVIGIIRILLVSAKKSAEASITSMANLTLEQLQTSKQRKTRATIANMQIPIQYMMLRFYHSLSSATAFSSSNYLVS